jgi:glycosyltransferase involved in cell wall biosynthesis
VTNRVIGIDASKWTVADRTGTENYTVELLTEMASLDSPDWLRFYFNSQQVPENAPKSIQARAIPARRLWTIGRLSFEMLWQPPDLLFVPAHTVPPVHPLSVVTVHDLGYLSSPAYHSAEQRAWLDMSTRRSVLGASHVIAVSETTKRDLIERYDIDPASVTVIHHGVRQPSGSDRPGPPIDAPTPGKAPFVLAVGTIHARKNFVALMAAMRKLRDRGLPHELIIAGKRGWRAEEVESLAFESSYYGWTYLLGYVDSARLDALYRNAALLAIPSIYEGFGLPALEAMVRSTPVVASSRGALPEVCGDAARYLDPFDVDSIATAIASVLSDRNVHLKLVARGHERAAMFDWNATARQTLALLRTICEERRGHRALRHNR